MSDLDALLAGIVEDPTNDLLWWVLADWLRDHGEEDRADLVQIHRQLLLTAATPDADPERDQLHAKIIELLQKGVQPCVPKETIFLPGNVPMTFSFIPPGSFLMGSKKEAENPVHTVTLTKGFWMGVTPVTQAQWQAVMGNNPSRFKGPQLPVETVSWINAVRFCQAVQQKCGIALQLPTEAEWEYACRAGTTTDYFSGDGEDALKAVGWYEANSSYQTEPVGQLTANAWNLYDMHGNVWEWCADWYSPKTYQRGDCTDPRGPDNGSHRVFRGGSWLHTAESCRAAFRNRSTRTNSNFNLGFRLARVPSGNE